MAVYSRYAPEFAIRIGGEPIPDTMRSSVSSVSYQTGIEGADRVEVALANPNLCWLDHPLLAPDNGFKLEIGYRCGTDLPRRRHADHQDRRAGFSAPLEPGH
jgi:hypothetical protein